MIQDIYNYNLTLKGQFFITRCIYMMAFCLIIFSCAEREEAIPVVTDFEIEVLNNDFSVPVQVRLINKTQGADTYKWIFLGATPSQSTDRNPGTITYTEAGTYNITLEASNQDGNLAIKELEVPINAEIIAGFDLDVIGDLFPPVTVALTNTTVGANAFQWTFQNGTPETASTRNPNQVVFETPGTHRINLEVSNGLETQNVERSISVAPHLQATFDYEVSLEANDFQIPVTLTMINKSISATSYKWTFTGGMPATSTEENPTVTFNTVGTHTLQLEATNGKDTKIISQSISVQPNTNLRVFNAVRLGINTAHSTNTIGAFFSTTKQAVYTSEAVTTTNGGDIDIVFFGLNKDFEFNKFVTPDEAETLTFNAIPNAKRTKFINVQESCECTASLSVNAFDAITDDTFFKTLILEETEAGLQSFDGTVLPRIVLFETEDGRKGALKIEDFVEDGANSYINTVIKVQKR